MHRIPMHLEEMAGGQQVAEGHQPSAGARCYWHGGPLTSSEKYRQGRRGMDRASSRYSTWNIPR